MTALRAHPGGVSWTPEQRTAIDLREGELLLDAAAGSGKTSVLVERFVRAVLDDGVGVGAILAITFTDKAAAELRDRIRRRLRDLGANDAARDTESAFICTIHGFCARVLRVHALAAGIDPAFRVLDEQESVRLARVGFDAALEGLARDHAGGVELIAAYGVWTLGAAITAAYGQLRSGGRREPRLPQPPPAPDLEPARRRLIAAAAAAVSELQGLSAPGARVLAALDRLERCGETLTAAQPWPGELDALRLPGGNGAALSTPVCEAYTEALAELRRTCAHLKARDALELLDELLAAFGSRYAALKRQRSALDFEDLELITRDLLRTDAEVRERYRARFAHVLVDELQDTNAVQLELIEQVADGNLFTVGDAHQSIYAFRHADVELFERLADRLAADGARLTLRTNFRSRPEILAVVGSAFASDHGFGPTYEPLLAGRERGPAAGPLVELLVVDRAGDWPDEGIVTPWRIAEAHALARRVSELVATGASPRDVVVLTRATTDLRAYERALEQRGVATYVIGGRGYWSHPQVLDVVAYLRALANPLDEESLYTVLLSPLVGVSLDAAVTLAAAARDRGRDPHSLLRSPGDALDRLLPEDRDALSRFIGWFAAERAAVARTEIGELIERMLTLSGYDLTMLALPGGPRRLANVRKLMRLAHEHEQDSGRDLPGFLEAVRGRQRGWGGYGDARESEAPVEGEALDAVRLMTIHRAKGLEFEIVCVADLARQPRRGGELLRIGRDGRVGIRLAVPGTGRKVAALDYDLLGDEQAQADAREERRVFYVAMTRARERLIVSGALRLDAEAEPERAPIGWIYPALVSAGVEPTVVRECDAGDVASGGGSERAEAGPLRTGALPQAPVAHPPAARRLSYSALEDYRRCGYRFYIERVLEVPPVPSTDPPGAPPGPGLGAAERGVLIHALLERLDFRRPVVPSPAVIRAAAARTVPAGPGLDERAVDEIESQLRRFAESEICARLGRAVSARREQRFTFLLGGELVVTGALDVLAREPGGGLLVVDYKSDRLGGADPGAIVGRAYATQQVVYALAAVRARAAEVEVAHVFLESPDLPVYARFAAAQAAQLERRLRELSEGVAAGRFAVALDPHRALCSGCPAEGGLCSWPLELTRREAPDTLF